MCERLIDLSYALDKDVLPASVISAHAVQKGTIAMSKMVLLTTTILCVIYVLIKIAMKSKSA